MDHTEAVCGMPQSESHDDADRHKAATGFQQKLKTTILRPHCEFGDGLLGTGELR